MDRPNLIETVCRHIETHLEEDLSLAALGKLVALSPGYLQRTFKQAMGLSPKQYAEACRVERLKTNLKTQRTVTMAMLEAGYNSSSRLYEGAAQKLGMTPATYKNGGKNTTISYVIARCGLGRILLAGTERGICMLSLGDNARDLEAALRAEFPAARLEKADETLQSWLDDILLHLDGHKPALELPLDVQATAFQWRVWYELQKIPYGSTKTYSEVAEAIGQPKAARAVARACATNPVSVVIPCHRVVREDGSMGGYRWGLGRKEELLRQERKHN
jgi:AraC family transcriptional regulator of adaptative response/methylated-DNA-[protein]-cysteine methyltransferase